MNRRLLSFLVALAALFMFAPLGAVAGPPFATDDPEPVEYKHWEFYTASQHTKTADGWSGTAPQFEVNYGAVSNVQIHLIAPLAYDLPVRGPSHHGYGDTELGLKFRFVEETAHCPQVGVFPLLEIPTGDHKNGLGNGHVQAFLPLWLQKDLGNDWMVYGGGGYGINPGAGNRNWGYVGMVAQRQVVKNVLLGGELYHRTAMDIRGRDDTAFNLATVIDFGDHHHILFSAGRSIDGPTRFQSYIAYQFTFGPELFHSEAAAPRP